MKYFRCFKGRSWSWAIILFLGSNLVKIAKSNEATSGPNNSSSTTSAPRNGTSVTIFSDIDFETLSKFGFSHELAEEFRINLIKAIEAQQDLAPSTNPDGSRQEGGGGGGGEESEEDGEGGQMMMNGPGAFGVLSGIFGIVTGLGSLNPSRVIQSTVNFFPAASRPQVQRVVDSLIGYKPNRNQTSTRPKMSTTPMTTLVMESNSTTAKVDSGMMMMNLEVTSGNDTSTTAVPKGADVTSTSDLMSMNDTASVVPKDAESNNDIATAPKPTKPPPTTTEPYFINLHEFLNMTTTPPPLPQEDDETDNENKMQAQAIREKVSVSSGYKLAARPKPSEKGSRETGQVSSVEVPDAVAA